MGSGPLFRRNGCRVEKWLESNGHCGGDFVLIHRRAKQVGLILADACGHGPAAAEFAAAARATLHAGFRSNLSLETFQRWNGHIHAMQAERFVAFTYLAVDRRLNRARMANAGNPPVLLFRKRDNCIREFPSTGMPLGLIEPENWVAPTMIEFPIRRGDEFVLFTDGLIDRCGAARQRFGIDRVLSTMTRTDGDSRLDALGRTLADFTDNATEQDDLTVISVRA